MFIFLSSAITPTLSVFYLKIPLWFKVFFITSSTLRYLKIPSSHMVHGALYYIIHTKVKMGYKEENVNK